MRNDLRYALRGLARSQGFTVVAVTSLALGIGANTAIFSLMNAIMLRLLPVAEPSRLVELLFKAPNQDHFDAFSLASYQHYRDDNHVFSGLIATSDTPFAMHGDGLEPLIVHGGYVTPNYFTVLGVKPAAGRLIGPGDGAAGASDDIAVVSWPFWKNRLRGDPSVVGRRIMDGDRVLTVIGVTPPSFSGLEPSSPQDIWQVLTPQHPRTALTNNYWLKLVGRLKPQSSINQARAEMAVLWQWTLDEEFKAHGDATVRAWKIEVQPAATGLSRLRDQYGKPVVVLMTVVSLLLLIACTNVASLMLARGTARQREMAVRASLGASRFRLLRQGLTESLLLSAIATTVGVGFAYAATAVLVGIIESGRGRIDLHAKPDALVLLFTGVVAIVTAVLFGLAPAWHASAAAPASSLRDTGRAGDTKLRRLFGKGLVVVQVALSVVLLSAAGLFVHHLLNLEHRDLGFQRDHVLLIDLNTAASGLNREQMQRASQDLLALFEAVPGVRSATITGYFPLAGVGAMRPANVEGYQAQQGERRFLSENWVAPRYFETLGIPLVMGRDFSLQDAGRPRVAIVNETLVQYFFGDANPIGRHITFDGDTQAYEIVGVVRSAKSSDLQEPDLRFVYMNMFQAGRNSSQFVLRTSVDPMAVAGEVRGVVRSALPTASVERVKTLSEQVDGAIVPERLLALLSELFGTLGGLLAALGVFGLLAYMVARRAGEIGVRLALGATKSDITRMVFGEALAMTALGLMAGIGLAWWGRRLVTSVVEGLPADRPFPLVFASVMIALVAIVAALVPARRAAHVDPMTALRYE
jgi:predicted permease